MAMRYMLDTCAFIDSVIDADMLGDDINAIIDDVENESCISIETVREVIMKYKNKHVWGKTWKRAEDILSTIRDVCHYTVLPFDENTLRTYARMDLNEAQDHRDPSDHIIIAHAMTLRMPLISRDRKFDFYRRGGLELIYYGR